MQTRRKHHFSLKINEARHKRRHSGRARGSVILEATLVLLFFLAPLFVGLVQFGVFYATTNALSQFTREAGRLTAVYGRDALNTPANPGSDNDVLLPSIRTVAQNSSLDANYIMNNIRIEPPRASRTKFSKVTVTVSYDLSKQTFIPIYRPGVVTRKSVVMIEK